MINLKSAIHNVKRDFKKEVSRQLDSKLNAYVNLHLNWAIADKVIDGISLPLQIEIIEKDD